MRNKIYLLLLAVWFGSQGLFAQHQKHTHSNGVKCGSDHLNEQFLLNNPEIAQKKRAFDKQISDLRKVGMVQSILNIDEETVLEIPIVIHIMHLGETPGTGFNPSDQQIIDWVNHANEVLAGTANGIVGEGNGGTDIPIRLVLAKRTPNCEPTNGIVRVDASSVPGYAEHGVHYDTTTGPGSAATGASHEDIRNLSRWNPESYYNIYVINNISDDVYGFAYFPGTSIDIDGSFMRTILVGTNNTTFAHEMGHAFGLYHTFQGASSSLDGCPPTETDCTLQGDRVCDTEIIKNLGSISYYDYPDNNTINPCTGVNYQGTQYNIMGYGANRNKFSPGQRERALLQVLQYRGNLLNSLALQEPEVETPTISLVDACIPEASQFVNYGRGPVKVTFGDISAITNGNDGITAHYYNYVNSCLVTGSTDIPGYDPTTLSVTITYSQKVRAYIDWNNNGIFEEATETVIGASNGNNVPANSTLTLNVTPPPYAVKGTALRMRVIADHYDENITPCYTPIYGQVEDYAVTVIETISGCDGISEEITAEISQETAYSGSELYLTANGVLGSEGIEYQWQQSSDGVNQWIDIVNGDAMIATIIAEGTIGNKTFYRLKVTCTDSQTEYFSSIVFYEIVPEYCAAAATSTNYERISNVTFATINNSSTSLSGYEDYTSIIGDVILGDTYSFSASFTGQSYLSDQVLVWIDFNNNGSFDDEGELVLQKSGISPWTGNITIPENVSLGERRMRVRLHDTTTNYSPNNTPCGNSDFGQVEDYTINITDVGCSGISDTIVASVVSGSGIENSELILTAEGVQGVQGISYQWQKAINNVNDWQDITNANTKNLTTTIDTAAGNVVYYRLKIVCTDTQTTYYSEEVILPIYCVPTITQFRHESITNINVSDINHAATTFVTYYFPSPSIAGNLTAGETYPFNAIGNEDYPQDEIRVWVDFNKNGSFDDDGELILITSGASPWNGNITIPGDVESGVTRMRVRLSYGTGGTSCQNNTHGQTIDLMVNVHSIEGCTGISENIIANILNSNSNTITLGAEGVAGTSQNVSYQWQQNIEGTSEWEDIENGTTAVTTVTIWENSGQTINYRLKVTCNETQDVYYSQPVSYLFVLNYCSAGATNNTAYDVISNVTFADINNNSTSTIGYEDFSSIIGTVTQGETYPFFAKYNGYSQSMSQILVWIDFNNNGVFTPEERVLEISGTSPWNGNITIPDGVIPGNRRMRIRLHYAQTGYNPNYTACGNSLYGQVEDYTITIFPNLSGVCSSTTTWNGTSWSNGNPDITKKAIINGVLVMNTDLSACELEVTENGKITIPADYTLTVKGQVINNATVADFIVANDAMLIQIDEAENQGAITVLKNSNPMKRLDYTLWSSPVEGMLLKNFSQVSASGGIGTIWNRVYTLGELAWDQVWNSYSETENGSHTFNIGKGYLYRARNDYHSTNTVVFEGEFTGIPNNGNLSINTPLSFNGIGNPYPSAIDAYEFITANSGVNALYFWTNVNAPVDGSYTLNNWAYYSITGGTGIYLNGQGEQLYRPNGIILPGQGFVTETSGAQVAFNNTMRTADSGGFFRQMNIERHRYWLNLTDDAITYNQILVGYIENATQGVDTGIDAQMFSYEGNAIYSLIENSDKQFVIQGRELPFTDADVVPIGFRAVNTGSFTIALDSFDGLFAEGYTTIYLKDNFNGSLHNLNSGTYTFVSEEGVFDNRFEIVYQTTMSIENPESNDTDWIVYKQDKHFHIQTSGFELKEVWVYDLLGRILYKSDAENTTHIIPALDVEGVFIVKVVTTQDKVLNKKVR